MRTIPPNFAAVKPEDKFGLWAVTGPVEGEGHRYARIPVRCECGTERKVLACELVRGRSKSCGCMSYAQWLRHGHASRKNGSQSKTYTAYSSMLARCHNPHVRCYARYGGRGITVCDRWRESFGNFLADMGEIPVHGMQLDRIDNSKGYGPENCRWATRKENGRNKRNSRMITAFGQTRTLAEWAEKCGFRAGAIASRIDRGGWSPERALTVTLRRWNDPVVSKLTEGELLCIES
jgi:drug/metabolite transporter superfamily protein YnfA